MQVGDVVRLKCGGDSMVVVAIEDATAKCRWPHPDGLEPLKAKFPVEALEPAPPRPDIVGAWLDALRATEDALFGKRD